MSDQDEINQLRAKLQEQAAEFQSYKQQCKNIEAMLQEENQKKEEEIKQLKQQSIKREKGQKMLKAQASQLEAELENMKNRLVEASNNAVPQQPDNKQQIQYLRKQCENLTNEKKHLIEKSQSLTLHSNKLNSDLQDTRKKLVSIEKQLAEERLKLQAQSIVVKDAPKSQPKQVVASNPKLQEQLKKLKQKLSLVQKQRTKFQKLSKDREQQNQKLRQQIQQKSKKLSQGKKKDEETTKPVKDKESVSLSEHTKQVSGLKESLSALQAQNDKLKKSEGQLRHRLQSLMGQKQALLQKLKSQTRQMQMLGQRKDQKQSPQIMIQGQQPEQTQIGFSCLLLTKKHYISPFVEIKDKTVKVLKSTKNGFEKSLGATKHRFNWIGYEQENLIAKTIDQVKSSSFSSDSANHSVIIYGAKKTSKKYIMAGIIVEMKQWLIEKIQETLGSEGDVKCVYMKRSQEQEKNYLKQAVNNKEEIMQVIEEVISLGQKKSPTKSSKKTGSKPKIRYFCISFSTGWHLQIITSSVLNPFLKNNETFQDYLNNIVFNKLPNILPSAFTNYHIITTINPIVNLYEQCKNTLSITLVPLKDKFSALRQTANQVSPVLGSSNFSNINKDQLNELTKRRLENFEKQSEQTSLKVRRIEQQVSYYRNRFEQLEVRLKNLMNTHKQQNSYLKKSPVQLSYEKLLKYVLVVLGRNQPGSTYSKIGSPYLQKGNNENNEVEKYIEQDAKSLDGY